MSINKSVARQWVAALRSGEFRQGKGLLSYYGADGSRRFCCLGVLCELAVEDRIIEPGTVNESNTVIYDDVAGIPSERVRDYVGVDDWYVTVPAESLTDTGLLEPRVSLDALNDVAGWSFDQIADAIERHYELADD